MCCSNALQGFTSQAMAVTCDPEHKFDLALQLADLKTCYQLAVEAEVRYVNHSHASS